MDYEQLFAYVEFLVELKKELKCAICLDVTLDVVELNCGHRFCKTCFQLYKSYDDKKIECPLCKKSLSRRTSIYKDNYADALSLFVREGCKKIKNVYCCEVEKLYQCLKHNKLSGNVCKEQISKLCVSEATPEIQAIPSTSEIEQINKVPEEKVPNDDDEFEKLSPNKLFNRRGAVRTYSNKKKKLAPDKFNLSKIQDNNKTSIVNWLNDTRNRFERISQTQCKSNKEESPFSFDLKSVSQESEDKEQIKTIEQDLNKNSLRAKSADRDNPKRNKPRVKRHSYAGETSELENSKTVVEEKIVKEAEKMVIQNLLEEDCLDSFDQIIQSSLEEPNISKLNTAARVEAGEKSKMPSPDSGWNRLKHVKRTMKKGEKKTKQLNITLESNTSNSKIKIDSAAKGRTDIVSDCHNVEVENKLKELGQKSTGRSYDLDAIENYIASNMKFIDQNKSTDTSSLINVTENDNLLNIQKNENNNEDITKEKQHEHYQKTIVAQIHRTDKPVEECNFCEFFKQKYQEVKYICTLSENNYSDNLLQTLHDYVNNIMSLIYYNKDELSKLLTNCFSHINLLLKKYKELKSEKRHISVAVQTSNSVETKEVQTEIEIKNVSVQTEILNPLHDSHNYSVSTIPIAKAKANTEFPVLKGSRNENNPTSSNIDQNTAESPSKSKRVVNNRPASESSKEEQNFFLTGSLDNFNFETQEVSMQFEEKRTNQKSTQICSVNKIQVSSDTLSRNQQVDNISQHNRKSSGSLLHVSLDSDTVPLKKVNRKLTFSEKTEKKFKRIRMPSSQSDSDGEESASKRICNRFIRSDLSIKFTNTEKVSTQALKGNEGQLTESGSIINYDEYLDEVLKKYDSPASTSRTHKQPPEKSETQARLEDREDNLVKMLEKCDHLIEQATKTIGSDLLQEQKKDEDSENQISKRTVRKLPSTKSSADTSQNNLLTGDNFFMDEHNLQELDKKFLEFEQEKPMAVNSESSDIIGETEGMNPVAKRRKILQNRYTQDIPVLEKVENKESESIFTTVNFKPENPLNVTQENIGEILKSINNDIGNLEDDVDVELEEIHSSAEQTKSQEKEGNVVILENIKLKSQDKSDKDIDTNLKADMIDDSNDEVFSDDDVVESTPHKDKSQNRSILSQLGIIEDHFRDQMGSDESAVIGTSENVLALPPPPGFEDDFEVTNSPSKNEVTVVDKHRTLMNKSSLTPDGISQLEHKSEKENSTVLSPKQPTQVKMNMSLNKKSVVHSTPFTQNTMAESIGMSPIHKENYPPRQTSFVSVGKSNFHSPLVTTPKLKTQTIMTSTPKQKSIWNYVKTSQENSDLQKDSQRQKPRVACTRLSKDQITSLSCMTNKKLITFSSEFTPSVTHMVVSVNPDGCLRDHTIKYALAVASGIWVVRFQWVQDCLNSNSLLPEEPYEALDISGSPGPRMSRLTRKTNPLFKGFKFHCAPPFDNLTKNEVEEIIELQGGIICSCPKDLNIEDGMVRLIITETSKTQDFEMFENWLELYRVATVDVEWLVRSVGQYKLISIRPFVLCSDDFITELGYPPALTEVVPFSFSEPL